MNVLRFDSGAAWAAAVATFWRDRLLTNPQLRICLPTGLTPVPVYAEMVRSVRAGQTSFSRASAFALDEYGELAPDDLGRKRQMLSHHLIDHVDLPTHAAHFLDPDLPDTELQCRRYDEAIGDGFDLVILGIGLNGHLGMNEPGSPADSRTRRVDLHASTIAASARYLSHRNLPRWGITVGLKPILASKEIWLLGTGASKAAIIHRTVTGEVGENVPASLLRRHPNCSVFVDADAGGLLMQDPTGLQNRS
jgi:glucosamine-6-phosphate deaminase